MNHSAWPRLRRAAACCCPGGQSRLLSSTGRLLASENGAGGDYDGPRKPAQGSGASWMRPARKRWGVGTAKREIELREQRQRLVDGAPRRRQLRDMTPTPREEKPATTDDDANPWGALDVVEAPLEQWPLLKRRESARGITKLATVSSKLQRTPTLQQNPASGDKEHAVIPKSHVMLTISGLSKNVNASDFYRISENDLSKWNESIRKGNRPPPHLAQERDKADAPTLQSRKRAT